MNVGILSYSSVCQRKFLPALLLNHSIKNISIASSSKINIEKSLKKITKNGLEKIVSEIISQCKKRDGASGFAESLKSWGDETGIGTGQIMMTTRVILTGGLTGVGVQEIVSFIGLESVGRRGEKFGNRI